MSRCGARLERDEITGAQKLSSLNKTLSWIYACVYVCLLCKSFHQGNLIFDDVVVAKRFKICIRVNIWEKCFYFEERFMTKKENHKIRTVLHIFICYNIRVKHISRWYMTQRKKSFKESSHESKSQVMLNLNMNPDPETKYGEV